MDQQQILEQIDEVAQLDDQARNFAERIVVQMFQEVGKQIKNPQTNHFASFLLSYLKKQPQQIPCITAQIIFLKCTPNLINSLINELILLIDVSCFIVTENKLQKHTDLIVKKQQDQYQLLVLIGNLIYNNVQNGHFSIQQNQIQILVNILKVRQVQSSTQPDLLNNNLIQQLSDILYLIVQYELQQKKQDQLHKAMIYSNMILSQINIMINQTQQADQSNLLKNLNLNQQLLSFLLYNSASNQIEQNSEAFTFLINFIIKFQLIHVHSEVVTQIIKNIIGNHELFGFRCLYAIFKSIIANPYCFQAKEICQIISLLILMKSDEQEKLVVYNFDNSQDVILKLINTDFDNVFSLANNCINSIINCIQLGASQSDASKQLGQMFDVLFNNLQLKDFLNTNYGEFLQKLGHIMNQHSYSQQLVLSFKSLINHYHKFQRNLDVFKPICQIILREFEYYQQKSPQIQQTIEYFLKKMTFDEAFNAFDVSLQHNIYLVKLISTNCRKSSLITFYNQVVYNYMRQVVQTDADDSVKNIVLNQFFEILLTVGSKVYQEDYQQSNLQTLNSYYQNMLSYLDIQEGQLNHDVCKIVLQFLNLLLENCLKPLKVKQQLYIVNEDKSNLLQAQKAQLQLINQLNFKVYVQQYLIPLLLPQLISLVTNDKYASFQYVTESLSPIVFKIIRHSVQALATPTEKINQCIADWETIQSSFDSEILQQVIQINSGFSTQQLLKTISTNIVRHITTFQNQGKEIKQQTLELLSSLLSIYQNQQFQHQEKFLILGDRTSEILHKILTQLLTNENYVDIRNKTFKLLAQFSYFDYAQAIQLYQSSISCQGNNNLKHTFTFLQHLKYESLESYSQVLPELRQNYNNINSKVRQVANELYCKFINQFVNSIEYKFDNNQFNEYLNQLGGQLKQLVDQLYNKDAKTTNQLQNIIIEATYCLFEVGRLTDLYLTQAKVTQLITQKQKLPELPIQFAQIASILIQNIEQAKVEKIPILKQYLNYIEIFCCNASSQVLSSFMEENFNSFNYLFMNMSKINHVRIPVKRIFTALGICCGRDFVGEFMNKLENNCLIEFEQQEDVLELNFSERQRVISNMMASQRNIISRVNKIIRKVTPSNFFGRYEAGQYLLVCQQVPKQLVSQLKYQNLYDDKEFLELEKILLKKSKKQIAQDEKELDQLVDEAQEKINQMQQANEDDLILQNVVLQKEQRKEETYGKILEQLNKIKQRRLYKVDARFQRTGIESRNKRGGDVGLDVHAKLPLINTKSKQSLQKQNKQKYRESMSIIFGKENKKLADKINYRDKLASRRVQGGKQKVKAMKKKLGLAKKKVEKK